MKKFLLSLFAGSLALAFATANVAPATAETAVGWNIDSRVYWPQGE